MADEVRLRSVYIAAVGGQGGNLFTEWLTSAATIEGQRAQSVSLTGLSQRGGATGYYVELASGPKDQQDDVVFCQYPVPGEVDVLVGQELLEMARAVEQGLTSAKTTVITSTNRLLSTPEKLPAGGGIMDSDELVALGRAFSGRFIGFDSLGIARDHGLDEIFANAVLFGALAASDTLGIARESFEQAIRRAGIAADRNVKAFEIGWDYVHRGQHEEAHAAEETATAELVEANAARLGKRKARHYAELFESTAAYPDSLRRICAEALYRLLDYQNARYAQRYLMMVDELRSEAGQTTPAPLPLVETYARNLATMMTYEDASRVAQLKIRQGRFDRIKSERGLDGSQVYELRDYLKPDPYEIYGLFPAGLVDRLLPLGRKLFGGRERYLELKPKTNSVFGVLTFWFLTLFIPFRPRSYRYRDEWRIIQEYRTRVSEYLVIDCDLAVLAADTGQMVKGYGHTRRKTRAAMERYIANIVQPLVELERPSGSYALTIETARTLRQVIASDDPGIDKAEELAREVLARARSQNREELLRYVGAQPQTTLVTIAPATKPAAH